MRVQGKRLRAALQHHRLLSPAPRQHGAGDEAAGGDHEAAGSGDGAAGGGAEASDRGFLRAAVTGFGAACFGAALHMPGTCLDFNEILALVSYLLAGHSPVALARILP